MTGVYPKVVQQVMRHQSITLTMDTYGHLFPGQEADAVGRMRQMLGDHQAAPEALRATGTDNRTAKGAQQQAQQSERETRRSAAKGCERETEGNAQKKTPKPLQIADLGDDVRCTAKVAEEGLERPAETPGNSGNSKTGDAESDVNAARNAPAAPDLQSIIDAWPNLTDEQKAAILVIIDKSVTSQGNAVHE